MPPPTYLEGHISIRAALAGKSRPVHRLLIADEGVRAAHEAERLAVLARQAGIPMERPPRAEIDALAGGRSHGGMLAEVGERWHVSLASLAEAERPFVVMLDGVEDPYNYGAAVRSLYAAGVTGLVVRPRSWLTATAIVARASAGASELISTALADDPMVAAAELRRAGLTIACAAERPGSVPIHEADLRGPLFVLIGGERRGVMRTMLDQADLLLRIPYARAQAPSLGTAAAAAVIGFEIAHQREG